MITITTLQEAKEYLGDSAAALGNFDGVHKGHQALIRRCVELSKEKGLESVVFTFLNHPANEVAGRNVIKNIMTLKEKAEAIEELGADALVSIPFDEKVMTSSPEEFVRDILVGQLHARHAVCGFNYSFGYKGAGKPEDLKAFGDRYGFGVTVIDEFDIDDMPVSSTRIRRMLAEGNVSAYEKLTGRRYAIQGKVMQGQHLGRKMGFPTVNLSLNPDMALPLNGVYITEIYVNNIKYHSVTNIGNKPSVGNFTKNAETHIFNFSGDLYGQNIRVEFINLLRPEIKFGSIEELSAQIEKDCIEARAFHEGR
ncbi:MAG: bifunctional riboflavin kinase/FAD synthetase [Firmicutes bacterium]|nr:bifunctional riboflavin kinase/FAD synthetase [Bacillota bacterium]